MDARTALDRVQDFVNEADSFIESIEPEFWGDPDSEVPPEGERRFDDHGENEGLQVLARLIEAADLVIDGADHETQFGLDEAVEQLRELVRGERKDA